MRFIPADNRPFEPASHEDPAQPGVLKRVVAIKDELLAGRVQMINWARLPVGSSFRNHYHEDMEEVFLLTEGSAEMVIDGESVALRAGDSVVVSPGEQHAMKNTGTEDALYIVVGISLGQNGQTIVVEASSSET